MTADVNDANQSCLPMPSGASAEPARRWFTWPIVPVALLYGYGGLALASGALFALVTLPGGVCMLTGGSPQHPEHVYEMSNAQRLVAAFGWALSSLHGFLAIVAGRSLWRRRWRQGAIALVAGILVLTIMVWLSGVVHKLPPGRQVTRRMIDGRMARGPGRVPLAPPVPDRRVDVPAY